MTLSVIIYTSRWKIALMDSVICIITETIINIASTQKDIRSENRYWSVIWLQAYKMK